METPKKKEDLTPIRKIVKDRNLERSKSKPYSKTDPKYLDLDFQKTDLKEGEELGEDEEKAYKKEKIKKAILNPSLIRKAEKVKKEVSILK